VEGREGGGIKRIESKRLKLVNGSRLMMPQNPKLLVESDNLGELEAEILDHNPKTAEAILKNLPFEGIANVWGEEIYFNVPGEIEEENSQQEMEIGDIAFWPMGNAICIFFGPTPVSDSKKPKAYSPVNLFAKIVGDTSPLKKVRDGEIVRIKKFKTKS
jgi:hypothetical protein